MPVPDPEPRDGRRERHLRVVDSPSYSALPHEVMRCARLSRDARLLYAILQGRWWGEGECRASHATLAAEMDCTPRYLRVYLDELLAAGLILERLAGTRRSKIYRPNPAANLSDSSDWTWANTSETSHCPESNVSETSDSAVVNTSETSHCDVVNEKFPTVQSEVLYTGNTSKTSDSKKKKRMKKNIEETDSAESGGSQAIPAPTAPKPSKRPGRLPADIELSDEYRAAAEKIGLTALSIGREWPKFCDHWHANGRPMLDWLATWRNWCRRSLEFNSRDGRGGSGGAGAAVPVKPSGGKPGWSVRSF